MTRETRSDHELIEAIRRGDEAAMSAMMEKHDALVHYVVKRFEGRGREREDLVQLGSRRQILLFSCQSREVDYLTGRSGVHILNLQ